MTEEQAAWLTRTLYCAAAAVFLVGALVLWGAVWMQAGCVVAAGLAIVGAYLTD